MLAELASLSADARSTQAQPINPRHQAISDRVYARPRRVHIQCLVGHLRSALLAECDQFERGHVIYVDPARRYLGGTAIGAGNRANLVIEPRKILATGFKLGASGMILAHNHPSGECRPSEDDIAATKRLAWLGEMVDLHLIDHLIITATEVYSIRAGCLL